jgi:uncharacterized protein YwqG
VDFVADMTFRPVPAPLGQPVSKLGGQPVWLAGPQWPVSRQLGEPMRFLGQFQLPGEPGRLGYLFMTEDEDRHVDGTWEPESGENALIVQPGGRVPAFLEVVDTATGPSLRLGGDEAELAIDVAPAEPATTSNRLGGEPEWLQGDETPADGWRLLVQLDSSTDLFTVDFGEGVGYGFVSPDGAEGRFVWQTT